MADATALDDPTPNAQRPTPNAQRPSLWIATEAFDPWHLLAWVERWARAKALGRGGVWVHGAAAAWEGEGWLFPAWGGTGKTDLLGAVLRAGGRYCADDWAALGQDEQLHPVSRRLNLLPDNWRAWPEWRGVAGPAANFLHTLAAAGRRAPGRVGRRLARIAEGRLRTRLSASALFPHATLADPVPLRHVALLVSSDHPGVQIEPCDPGVLIPRILACHAVERRMPLDVGALVRFARPAAASALPGAADTLEADCLARAFAGVEACVVSLGPGSDPNSTWRRLVSRGA